VYEVRDVSDWKIADFIEAVGTKPKTWLRAPDGELWLFKASREGAREPSGEDWAEKAACEMAALLGLPHAGAELACRNGQRGVISANFVGEGSSLVHGNELLSATNLDYPQDQRSNDTPGYTVDAVREALTGVNPPESHAGASAFEWFAGYLVLDAWINNTDRHHMNWGVIKPLNTLAPSFDHGSSLAFGESDDRRTQLLGREGTSVAEWLERGRTKPFEGMPSMMTVAADALALCSEPHRAALTNRLEHLELAVVDGILDEIPGTGPAGPVLSDTARTLCKEILRINRERLLNVNAGN
jgi:hypothetical protein